jgi:5-formyltetrahydrofolate cyclo-ligase
MIMTIAEEKGILRKLIRQKRFELTEAEIFQHSEIIFRKIEQLGRFREAKVIMAYWSMPGEVFTHDFILRWFKDKIILLPVIEGDRLKVRIFAGVHSLVQEKKMGIYEPLGDDYSPDRLIDLVIVPGVAFDRQNNRLGHGRAFYDKFLKALDTYKIGICFGFQMLEKVPIDEHDIRMDLIISA